MAFDVKMDFTRKTRWVKDGHRTPEPDQSTFAGVVSRESVRIALTYAALNNIDVNAADIKKQGSIMTSSFGSEFIAMKQCCEYLRGLRYKLRMMGIPCDFPSYIYGDNQSVLVNSSVPTSVLKKKSCSIAYHFVREGVAADEWRMTYISTHDNVADLFTKALRGGEKRLKFIRMFLHHI